MCGRLSPLFTSFKKNDENPPCGCTTTGRLNNNQIKHVGKLNSHVMLAVSILIIRLDVYSIKRRTIKSYSDIISA